MEPFYEFKVWASELSHLDRDSLHIHISIVAYLLACFVLRKSASSLWPWLVVLLIAIGGEYLDSLRLREFKNIDYPTQETLWRFHAKDLINTMVAPTILFLSARFTNLFEKPAKRTAISAEEES